MAMGGVGEAMLLGAAMGGGSAALTGGDPLKGALMGGLTGGIGGGFSSALGSAVAPTVATTAATSMAPTIANAAAINAAATAPAALTTASQVAPAALPAFSATPIAPAGTLGSGTFGILPEATGGISNLLTNSAAAPIASAIPPAAPPVDNSFLGGMKKFADNPMSSLMNNKFSAAGSALVGASQKKKKEEEEEYSGPLSRFKFNPDSYQPSFFAAEGGIATLAAGGYDRMVGEEPMYMSNMASGGISNLGSYSDGGRMLKGPGDGMSDSIPASISGKRPARLADGEFVVPADVVSHLGNGSTDAGAKQLYAMMNKVRQARTGRKSQGREIDPRKYTPAYA
jgi:hypothetical protein